ncbi:sigma-70 family RNA polymerase sigma factor [Pedobacter sp. N36a]|uniref:sigma-70 family RNA polymerase sigma factor n=1 Tax=Pedobacter sp. N36a TaxID=2767996 RepID=UPI001656E0BA|nr:sigma-70 family RNA polymerase sigma factor [Pedobacter sp. N36a]MBC8987965.1 sigma-70 family RNA polymerase sigma factor [Pedobacter sp. N36a]
MPKSTSQVIIDHPSHSIRYLYDQHAGMLLGYIFEVVKDRKLAEDYLVKIFSALSLRDVVLDQEQVNTWCSLLKFAKAKLQLFQAVNPYETAPVHTGVTFASSANTYLDRLNELQRSVFCGVYHHGKTISALSTALNTTEDLTRKTLKEALLMMRSDG